MNGSPGTVRVVTKKIMKKKNYTNYPTSNNNLRKQNSSSIEISEN